MIQLRKTIQIAQDDFEWFQRTYGEDANLSWAVGELISKWRAAHVHTPAEYAALAADNLQEEIEDKQ